MIYAIQAESGPIKIGITNNLTKRLRQLQSGHYEALKPIAAQIKSDSDALVEEWIHEKLASSLIRGEWFRPTKEVLAFVELMKLGEAALAITQSKALEIAEDYFKARYVSDLRQIYRMCLAYERTTKAQQPAH